MDDPNSPTSTGLKPNVSMLLSWLFGFIFFFIEKKHQPSRFWAKQSLVVLVLSIAYQIVMSILGSIGLGALLVIIALPISLAILAFVIYGAIQAWGEKQWEIPFVYGLSQKYLPKD